MPSCFSRPASKSFFIIWKKAVLHQPFVVMRVLFHSSTNSCKHLNTLHAIVVAKCKTHRICRLQFVVYKKIISRSRARSKSSNISVIEFVMISCRSFFHNVLLLVYYIGKTNVNRVENVIENMVTSEKCAKWWFSSVLFQLCTHNQHICNSNYVRSWDEKLWSATRHSSLDWCLKAISVLQ